MEANSCVVCLEALAEPTVACENGHGIHAACYRDWRKVAPAGRLQCAIRCGGYYPDHAIIIDEQSDCIDHCLYYRQQLVENLCGACCVLLCLLPTLLLRLVGSLVARALLLVGAVVKLVINLAVLAVGIAAGVVVAPIDFLVCGSRRGCDAAVACCVEFGVKPLLYCLRCVPGLFYRRIGCRTDCGDCEC
jgi:hypothetical protein